MGALALLAALWPIVIGGMRDRRGLVPGAAVSLGIVLVAVVLAGAGARPSVAALDWQNWDLFGESRAGHTVVAVWRSDYGGIDFPPGKTTVLKIKAPRRALYWRATTLDTFASDHWVETLYATGPPARTEMLPRDPLFPPAASSRAGWVKQEVDVRALVDDHVIAAGQPMEIDGIGDRGIRYLSGGVMLDAGRARRHAPLHGLELRAGTVSGVARPVAAGVSALARRAISTSAAPIVPRLRRPRTRGGGVERSSTTISTSSCGPYEPMWREASRLTAKARSPYEATITIERWLRSAGGFGYDEHPPAPGRAPPLVDFLERSKLGYCQQFAGTMALMLRYLGIPARVAVGFTSGTWKDGTWTVTDHDAHAWVEAWFAGLRLAHVRSDAGPRHAVGDVHERLGLGRRDQGARHRAVPRRRLVRTDDAAAWRGDPGARRPRPASRGG